MRGNYKLHNADCRTILPTIETDSIHCICSDIPYLITPQFQKDTTWGNPELVRSGKVFNQNDIDIADYAAELYRILEPTGHCYIMINAKNLIEALNKFTEVGFKYKKTVIWDKVQKITCPYYMTSYEHILMFGKGKTRCINNWGTSDIITIPQKKTKDVNGKNLHDTEKPVSLMEVLVLNSTQENETVLDPFMGIGATGIAAVKNNRNFIGIEIDEKYYKIAEERISEPSKQQTLNI